MKNKQLNRVKLERFVRALLEHPSIDKAAVAAEVSETTLRRWLRQPEFRQAYSEARREAFSRSLARLQHASSAAVSTLLKVMLDRDSPASAKVRAADCVLSHGTSAFEVEELELRLTQLEEVFQRGRD